MKLFRKISLRISYLLWALRKVKEPHLMETVIYKGIECQLIQGVNNPRWDLMPMTYENLAKPKRDVYKNVHVSEFKLQHGFKRFFQCLKQSYKFQMGYWYSIDIRRSSGHSYTH